MQNVLILTTFSWTFVKTFFYVSRTPISHFFEQFVRSFILFENWAIEKMTFSAKIRERVLKLYSTCTDEHYQEKQTFRIILVFHIFIWTYRGKKLTVDVFLVHCWENCIIRLQKTNLLSDIFQISYVFQGLRKKLFTLSQFQRKSFAAAFKTTFYVKRRLFDEKLDFRWKV